MDLSNLTNLVVDCETAKKKTLFSSIAKNKVLKMESGTFTIIRIVFAMGNYTRLFLNVLLIVGSCCAALMGRVYLLNVTQSKKTVPVP